MGTKTNRRIFGEKPEPHVVVIARGENVRYFTVGRRSLFAISFAAVAAAAVILSGSARYVLDDELSTGVDAGWQYAQRYEIRIADLRAQLDNATSRRFLSEKMVETKVDVLLQQQQELAERYDKLRPLFDQARDIGMIATTVPVPMPRPLSTDAVPPADGRDASAKSEEPSPGLRLGLSDRPADPIRTGSVTDTGALRLGFDTPDPAANSGMTVAALSSAAISKIGHAIDSVEWQQIAGLKTLAETTRSRAVRLASALEGVGVTVPAADEMAEGGPYEPVSGDMQSSGQVAFEARYAEVDAALAALENVRRVASTIPLSEPMPAARISSPFGVRSDPFLSRRAMHTGIDYAVTAGTPIYSQAPGTVVRAGSNGGYGNMVEIDHGNGITSRFGHMARVSVKPGQSVRTGEMIGFVGSTGRSTGPHLHYEVRVNGKAINPERLYRIDKKIGTGSLAS